MLRRPYCPLMTFGFLLILLSCIVSPNYACNKLDRDSLLWLALNISSPPSAPLNWPSDVNCCLWEGIGCGHNQRVTHLWLPSRGLNGNISPFLRNLTRLSHLNLSHNHLSGPLPDSLFSCLNHLQILDLSFNRLSGTITSRNSLPVTIETVDLSSNDFIGTIESSFLELAQGLVYFDVSNNSFTGPIPSFNCIYSPLIKILDFSSNDFQGQIPRGFSECSKLEVFRAGFNFLSGSLPYDIYTVLALKELSLPVNSLSGPVGNGIVQLSNLKILDLYGNNLTGELPRDIGMLSNLEHLSLHINNLSGSLPPYLMDCTNLTKLNLRINLFGGDLSALNFSKLNRLSSLDLGNNNFIGNFPLSLHSCKSLRSIRLAYNNLEGQVSPDIVSLQSLSFLSLSNNRLVNLTGAIKILTGCKNLSVIILSKNFINEAMPKDVSLQDSDVLQNLNLLALGGCHLTGSVPSWLHKLKNLKVLDLSVNQITGSIPDWLGTMASLFYLDLSSNHLLGEFPKELCGLPALTSKREATEVDLQYLGLPVFVQPNNNLNLQYIKIFNLPPAIYLGNNNLEGNIPILIGQLRQIHVLDLSKNFFKGSIPDQLSNLTNLENLDLSSNRLSGKIPESLGNLHFLSSFSVANNNLEGPISQRGQMHTFPLSSFEGNPRLCGLPINISCMRTRITGGDKHKSTQDKEDGFEIPWFYVVVGLGYATGILAVCTTLLFHNSWRGAYFQFLNDVKDKVYVIIAINVARQQRMLWGVH